MTDDAAVVQPHGAVGTNEMAEAGCENVTATKDEIFEFLTSNKKVFFKSQQIDDPELTDPEKRAIAEEIFRESPKKFLLRFGKFLERKHLDFFLNATTNDEEIQYYIAELSESLKTRRRDIKNRRYAAMQAMIKADSYFSEREMMKREPHLYEQLIGQYLTDSEKRQRDRSDDEEDATEEEAFSRVLLKNYDNEQMEDLRKQQARDDMSDDEDDATLKSIDSDRTSDDELFPKMPAAYRKQWGNFEDEPAVVAKKPAREQKYVTGAEREILRQEFLGIMYEKFLEGHDRDFDYEAVDDNAELDDLQQIGRDNEDKYFDADDDDDGGGGGDGIERIARMSEDESEDELDVYMKNLSRQPS